VCSEKESIRKEVRAFLDDMRSRHPGTPASVTAALANVNPFTLFDQSLRSFDPENIPVEVEID
jgi:hypothetical protein